jgi:hypothetical protein
VSTLHEGRLRTATPSGLDTRLVAALGRLQQGLNYARELRQDPSDFAVEIQVLFKEGLTNNDVRWLVCKEFVEHAGEITMQGDERRTFRPLGHFTFCDRSCFVMTEKGLEFAVEGAEKAAEAISSNGYKHMNGFSAGHPAAQATELQHQAPNWDRQRQELRLGVRVVKRFKVPAPNQELVLATFQEEGWPPRINDPIPPHPDLDPKRRLHDTINALNRCQLNVLIRFQGDGSGQGVRWEPVDDEQASCTDAE